MIELKAADFFSAKQKKSPLVYDLQKVTEWLNYLDNTPTNNAWLTDLSGVLVGDDGYILAEIWWDPEAEVFRADFTRYGEDV